LFATVTLPFWLLALLFVGWFITLMLLWSQFQERRQPWNQWNRGIIFGIQWRWQWQGRRAANPSPYCPTDNTRLVYHFRPEMRDVIYRCETCFSEYGPFAGDHSYVMSMIGRQIERRCLDGSWRDQLAATDAQPVDGAGAADGRTGTMSDTDNRAANSAAIDPATKPAPPETVATR